MSLLLILEPKMVDETNPGGVAADASEAKKAAKKASVKKASQKRAARKVKAPTKAEKSNKLLVWFVAAIIIIITVALLAYLAMSNGKIVSESEMAGPTSETGTPIHMSQLAGQMTEAVKSIKQVTVEGSVRMNFASADESQAFSTNVSLDMASDLVNKRGRVITTITLLGQEMNSEVYTIGNVTYIGTPDPYTGQKTWLKQEDNESGVSEEDIEELVGILDAVDGTLLGTETVNGEQADKIRMEPDVGDIVNALIESQYGNDLESVGLSREELDTAISQLEESIKNLEMTVWISKASSLPLKAEGSATVILDLGSLAGAPGMLGTADVSVRFSLTADYTTPVSITLPAEALNAIDLSQSYGYCGDGLCYSPENDTSCPEDCGQLVGNDRDEHGCIPSAGYSWCEAKQRCIRPWEENCTAE